MSEHRWVIRQRVDLLKGSGSDGAECALMLPGDHEAHEWVIEVYMDGVPAELTGCSAAAYFARADGGMPFVVGEIAHNAITFRLHQACYAVAGRVRAVARLTFAEGNRVVTLAERLFRVRPALPDEIIDPGEAIPDIDVLLAEIARMEAATADTAHAVRYIDESDRNIYQLSGEKYLHFMWENGNINSSGESTSTNLLRTIGYCPTAGIEKLRIELDSGYTARILYYSGNTDPAADYIRVVNVADQDTITIGSDEPYFRVRLSQEPVGRIYPEEGSHIAIKAFAPTSKAREKEAEIKEYAYECAESAGKLTYAVHDGYMDYRGSDDCPGQSSTGAVITANRESFVIDGAYDEPAFQCMRISGNLMVKYSSASSGDIDNNMTLLANHRYRVTQRKVSGSVEMQGSAGFGVVVRHNGGAGVVTNVSSTVDIDKGEAVERVYDIGDADLSVYLSIVVYATQRAGESESGSISFDQYRMVITIEDITGATVTPQMYGAIGDGVADDSIAFQLALNHSRKLYVPTSKREVYRITKSLTIPSECKQIYSDGIAFASVGAGLIKFDLSERTEEVAALKQYPLFINRECGAFTMANIHIYSIPVSDTRVGLFMYAIPPETETEPLVDYDMVFDSVCIRGFLRVVKFKGRGFTLLNSIIASCTYLGRFDWVEEDTNKNHPLETGQRALRFQNNRLHSISASFIHVNSGHAYGLVFTGNVIDDGHGPLFVATDQAWNWLISGNLVQGMRRNNYVMQFDAGMRNCVIGSNVLSSDTGYWYGTSGNPIEWLHTDGITENCTIAGNNFKNAQGAIINAEEMYGTLVSSNVFQGVGNLTYDDGDGKKHDYPIIYGGESEGGTIDPGDAEEVEDDAGEGDGDTPDSVAPEIHVSAIFIRNKGVHNSIVANVVSSNNKRAVLFMSGEDSEISDMAFTGNIPEYKGDGAEAHTIYGFHIDSTESDPSACVTYLADAVGMTPAAMDFTNDSFNWGSWADAFFLPRPCMLRYDGTVAYYLNPNDYTKKADGTASDVADDTFQGNAMMEWGRDGKKIWYKIVPDTGDNTSASVYIADYQADSDYHAWSFINNQGEMVDHFYTPIYNGSIDGSGRLRSISGKTNAQLCQSKMAAAEIAAAELNNPGTDKLWFTEVYADVTLINLLLILMGKSLNVQTAFGNGRINQSSAATSMLATGTMNDKGMFWGSNEKAYGVKVFGMENWWGNQWRRYAGHVMIDYVQMYKMTRNTADGSSANDYVSTGTAADYAGYLTGATGPNSDNSVKEMQFDENCFQTKTVGGTSVDSSHYWCDYWYQNSGLRYVFRGGSCYNSLSTGAFAVGLNLAPGDGPWYIGAAPSCKPLS